MTPQQREAALRLADELQRFDGAERESLRDEAAALLRELAAEPQGEPAAWIQPDHLQKARVAPFLCRVEPTKRMPDFVPLYIHPPQQRKPLTREQIDTVWSSLGSFTDRESDYRIFARAIERAHGITGEQK